MSHTEYITGFAMIWFTAGFVTTFGSARWFLLRQAIKRRDAKAIKRHCTALAKHLFVWPWREI